MSKLLRNALLAVSALTSPPVLAQAAPAQTAPAEADPAAQPSLESRFRDPPASARPRVWWHWMNGNITKDGIAKDLAWMKRVGIGGVQNFDAALQTPQIVDKRLVYMTPEWKDAFRFAATEADRLGLELAIAASPGWSETGGPWVNPQNGLKKLVWSSSTVTGGKPLKIRLASPPSATGPFQDIARHAGVEQLMAGEEAPKGDPRYYGDVAVLAFPDLGAAVQVQPEVRDFRGNRLEAAGLSDDNLGTGVSLPRDGSGRPVLYLDYPSAVTIRSASLFVPGATMPFLGALYQPRLEASADGQTWKQVARFSSREVPDTLSFPAVTARHFRLTLDPREQLALPMSGAPGVAGEDPFAGAARALAERPATVGDLRLSAEPLIDRFETKAGFALSNDYYALAAPADRAEGIAPGSVIDLTGRMGADGTLSWTPPKGRWRILRLGYSLLGTTNHPAPPEATGLEVDKFDGAAVREYLQHYLGMYQDAAGPDLIGKRGVRALLTDSIEVGPANWTPRLLARFRELRGYDPLPWLPTLTGSLVGSRADSDRFLYDYRRTLADLMASEHYGTVAAVAHEHGLKVYGEALEDHRPTLGDDMEMRRYADVPMAAMWTHSRIEGPRPTYLADIKGAASVAHIYGQTLVAAESLTAAASPWAFGPADLKRIIDLEFVTGVNHPIIHTSVHVPVEDRKPGLSLFIIGQYVNRNETWAELARPWIDYISRNSVLLQAGRNVADVAYFYGEEGPLTGLFGDKPVADAARANAYDFVNANAVTGALTNDGADLITPGGARYKALYLGGSSHQMTLPVLRKLAALVEGGATVIGLAPQGDPGLAGDPAEFRSLIGRLWSGAGITKVGQGRVIASNDITAALAQAGIAPDFHFTGGSSDSDIPFVHRALADGDSYFLVNRKDRTETIEARFRVTGKAPDLWHADSGTVTPLGYRREAGETVVPLTLAPDEAAHIVFRRPSAEPRGEVKSSATVELGRLANPWTVAFEQDRGAPATATFERLAPLDQNGDAGIKYFSGIATYATTFDAPRGWRPGRALWLDLGEAREVAEVTLNGKVAGYAWHAPYRLDVSGLVRPGRNVLQVRVANLWVNRLIGDAQPGARRVAWTAMPTYRPDAPLRRSGLIGPVTLLGKRGPPASTR
jgi:hypothetical protein